MVKIYISSQGRYPVNRMKLKQSLVEILAQNHITENCEISVFFCGDRKMSALHKQYLETEETTDVMSFPLEDIPGPDGILRLGDIVISYPQAITQAIEKNRMVDDEIEFLAGHGLLHLLGKHHE